MLFLTAILALLSVTGTCGAIGIGTGTGSIFEELRGGVPNEWAFSRVPRPGQTLKLRVSLQQPNVALFEQTVLDVSTPSHPKYGQHLEGHEVKAMLQPTEAASKAVISWLQENNVTAIDDDGDWVNFKTEVATANRLLNTEFLWYKSDYKGKERLRTLRYSVPPEVAKHINFVQPTIRFGNLRPMRALITDNEADEHAYSQSGRWPKKSPSVVNATCNTTITPQCLLELYNVHYKADPRNGNKIGFASFLEEYARYDDLAIFEKRFAPYAISKNISVIKINGGLNNQTSTENSGEANLDNQYVVSLGFPTPVTEFSTRGRGPLVPDLDQPTQADDQNEPYLDYLHGLLKLPNSKLPQTISHSYGEDEQSVPVSYAKQVCTMFAQLGARGVSVLFSSGDSGVGSACLSNDGKNTIEFPSQFPAACPFVTSVGGTYQIEPEVAILFSGGGFSRIFPRPAYQERAVTQYLHQLGNKNKGYFNPSGRGFPDVAAQSLRYAVINQGVQTFYAGTSCAVPTFAAIISLVSSARISSYLPPLGFLNPWIYSIGYSGLNDIVHGGSTGCNGNSRFGGPSNGSPVIPYASWNATKGWDPVTGYGTPDFGKLLALSTPWVRNEGGPLSF